MITKKQAQKLNGYINAIEHSAKEVAFAGAKTLDEAYANHKKHQIIKNRMQKFIRELTEPINK